SLQGIGVGIADLEAMAADVPLVVAVREDNFLGVDLADRGNVHLVPPNDPDALAARLIETIADPDEAQRMARAGATLVDEHFSMDTVLARHLSTLRQLVDE
ncbi:MAG: glycosyltransferase, partial [Pseudonocardiaceae bacterium]